MRLSNYAAETCPIATGATGEKGMRGATGDAGGHKMHTQANNKTTTTTISPCFGPRGKDADNLIEAYD